MEDFEKLPLWKSGLDIAKLCNLIVVPREKSVDNFQKTVKKCWKEANFVNNNKAEYKNKELILLDIKEIPLSSTKVRKLFLEKKSIDFLVSSSVKNFLNKNRDNIENYWKKV